METKNHKMSELDRLQLEKKYLREQIAKQTELINNHFSYMQNNIGSLIVNSTVQGVESKLPSGVRSLLSPVLGFITQKPQESKLKKIEKSSSPLLRTVTTVAPVVVDFMKPLIIGFVLKKVKKKLFGR